MATSETETACVTADAPAAYRQNDAAPSAVRLPDRTFGASPLQAGASVRRRVSVLAGLLGLLLVPLTGHATPIGDFSWSEHAQEECAAGLCGAFFSVGNFSRDPDFSLGLLGDFFTGVFVNLQTTSGPQRLALGDIASGNSSQSIDDLFGLTTTFAGLALNFQVPSLPGSIRLLDPDGNVLSGLTGPGSVLIDYAAASVAVPEPSMLVLFVSGLLGVALARMAKRRARGA